MGFVKGAWKVLVAIKDGLALVFLLLFFVLSCDTLILYRIKFEMGRLGALKAAE
mgnify:CR=1 FL=1